MKALHRRGFATPLEAFYTHTYTHLAHFPKDIGGICRVPRGFEELCKAPLQRGLCEASRDFTKPYGL